MKKSAMSTENFACFRCEKGVTDLVDAEVINNDFDMKFFGSHLVVDDAGARFDDVERVWQSEKGEEAYRQSVNCVIASKGHGQSQKSG
jgi:hypothetical protein